ncbi:MAG: 1-deoxy-D-xylulose-5-phosphate reductoisomerase [Planctomycetaceae bacterium]|nr:1-deoxy-D-xylulose-5-phosphate reductoisomerase [Planctomycetaceae bacterium]
MNSGRAAVQTLVNNSQAIVVLGSTGSIGTSSLDVIRSHPDRMRLVGAMAHRSADALCQQALEFCPDWVMLADEQTAIDSSSIPSETRLHHGSGALESLIRHEDVDTVVSAVVGAAGLESTWVAVDAGKRVAIANKESLVVAGPIIQQRRAETGALIFPVDSEHSAIFQALEAGRKQDLRRIILTASGGPFRGWTKEQMKDVTPEMALQHPTWKMGPKITVDSATMMNKALEIIEARWLFDVESDQISVVVHPQSFIHSFVEYRDGSVISQMSPPDMRLPIQYALTFPERIDCPCHDTDWTQPATMELFPPDLDAFPALRLGFEVARTGGTSGAILNAANEVAVERFLNHEIRFDQITQISQEILNNHTFDAHPSLDQLHAADRWARKEALRWNSQTLKT